MDKDYEAYKLWLEFEYESELCSRSISSVCDEDGFSVPVSVDKNKLISSNNRKNMNRALREKEKLKISDEIWLSAKKDVQVLNFQGIKDEYKRVFNE